MRDVTQKIIIALLIGIVSVTVAILTWRSAFLDEQALDSDRQAVAETVLQQQNLVNVDTQLRAEQEAFAEYRATIINADELEAEAQRLGSTDPAVSTELLDEATSLREVADNLANLTFRLEYVDEDPDTGELTFDLERRRDDLEQENEAAVRANPDEAVETAVALRDRSQRLVGWIVVLAAAIVILTLAQISKNTRLRLILVGGAMTIYRRNPPHCRGDLLMPDVELERPDTDDVDAEAPAFRRRVALAVVLITLFGAMVGYLQQRSSNLEDNAARDAQIAAITGLGTQVQATTDFQSNFRIFVESELLDRRFIEASNRAARARRRAASTPTGSAARPPAGPPSATRSCR